MEQRYHCRQCNLSFASGRVLGGHMKGHVARKKKQERTLRETAGKKPEAFDPCGRGYGLRENPKKSWKASRLRMRGGGHGSNGGPLGDVSVRPGLGNEGKERGPFPCRECGQVFGSLKSLSNHRRVHVQPEKFNHGRSDLEETLANVAPVCPVRRKRSRRVFYSPPLSEDSNCDEQPPIPSPVSETEQDVYELAFSLMLLSRGLRDPDDEFTEKILPIIESGLSNKVDQTAKDDAFRVKKVSDSNYKELHSGEPNEERKLVELKLQVDMVYLETEGKNSESPFVVGDSETVMRAHADASKLGCESDELEECHDRSRKNPKLEHNWKESKNKNKIKIKKGSPDHRIPSPTGERQEKVLVDPFPRKENQPEMERDSVDMDDKTYTCPTCYKVFGSSQALGGHKRVHSMKGTTGTKAGKITKVLNQFRLSDISNMFDLSAKAMCYFSPCSCSCPSQFFSF
ncbi:uncharacterized protein LOC116215270 [Punica granatum]|uniref:Uncharacterized protein LOC116215270 n=1 Tax=Punica granatum TaxID=22663 RepID=A0A218WR04_PUNGR|nr:uncharacterized protein LOC116215270 [Punica granatum]OWM74790.1 hypothetical protein CDL15_Pgr004557 [Punica granatum]